jgi:hypothetical protein
MPAVVCPTPEYNQCDRNANSWLFPQPWPHQDDGGYTLGLTLVSFDVDTGEIRDADVEINVDEVLENQDVDVSYVILHEAGHVLGLDHSEMGEAIMYPSYKKDIAELKPDDIAGICAAYPANRNADRCDPTPVNGFARHCGSVKQCVPTACGASLECAPRSAWYGALGGVLVVGVFGARWIWRRRRWAA